MVIKSNLKNAVKIGKNRSSIKMHKLLKKLRTYRILKLVIAIKVPAWNKAHRLNFPFLRVNEDVLSKFDSTVGSRLYHLLYCASILLVSPVVFS